MQRVNQKWTDFSSATYRQTLLVEWQINSEIWVHSILFSMMWGFMASRVIEMVEMAAKKACQDLWWKFDYCTHDASDNCFQKGYFDHFFSSDGHSKSVERIELNVLQNLMYTMGLFFYNCCDIVSRKKPKKPCFSLFAHLECEWCHIQNQTPLLKENLEPLVSQAEWKPGSID